MTLVSSISSSTADVNGMYNNKRLPKGVHIVGADGESVSRVGELSKTEDGNGCQKPAETDSKRECSAKEETELPWGYIYIHHMSASSFEMNLGIRNIEGDFRPRCFVHRTVKYKKNPHGKGIVKEEKPTVGGLVFLQGKTEQLRTFLKHNYPQYFLVNNCSSGEPASIADSTMRPFMQIMEQEPEQITFLRDPFVKFAKDHVKLRVLTGILAGQEGYVVRILKNRQLVMDFGGYAVAINNVHNEYFEIAE